MKKKISFILAAAMALTMLAGCKKTDEETNDLPEAASESVSLTTMTTTEATTTTTVTTTVTTTETSEETTSESESETTSETTSATTSATTTATAGSTTASKKWSETEISETLYITTACYSRKEAIVGSESVKKYEPGQKINVVAATDTGYYKLADGTFIHSDYVTDQAPAATVTTTAKTTQKTTTVITQEEFVTDTTTDTDSKVNSSYTKSYKDRYPYKQLSNAEQTLYADIVAAAESFNTQVAIPDGLTSDQIFKVYCLVYNQEPQLFWMSNTMPPTFGGMLSLRFDLTPAEAESAQAVIDGNVKSVMSKVNGYSSTISKLKVIYDWVITHNTFNKQGNYMTCGIYNGLGNGTELQCQGYAKTVLYLCDMAGIDCMVVTGKNTEGDTHAWNVVYCDNGYYILDSTWGDPYGMSYSKSDYVRYLFFLANDDMIKNTHLSVSMMTRGDGTEIKLYTPPACTKTACYYFKAYNKEYSDLKSAEQAIYDQIDEAIKDGKNVCHIRVTDHDMWETLTSDAYYKKFINYAKEKGASGVNRVKPLTEDILVVQYDVKYN